MKRIVLAKLNNEDAERLITLDSNAYTFKTLLKNQFLDDKDRDNINNMLQEIFRQKNEVYEEYVKKYNLPYIVNNNYGISPVSHELYIEVHE